METKKTKKGPGPKSPKWDPYSEAARKQGLKKGLAIMGGMAATAAAMFKKSPEEKLENKGVRQAARAERKTARAEKITAKGGSATRAAKLTSKASNLKSKSAANLKAADVIYKSKNPKMK